MLWVLPNLVILWMATLMVLASLSSYQSCYYSDPLQICCSFWSIISFPLAVSFFSGTSRSAVLRTQIYWVQVVHFYRSREENINRHQVSQNSLKPELNDNIRCTSFLSLQSFLLSLSLLLLHSLSLEIFFSVLFIPFFVLFFFATHSLFWGLLNLLLSLYYNICTYNF